MRHLDLFSGIGGFALAARSVGWETVGFCEIDSYCQKVLRKHWPDVPIHGDVETFDGIEADIITGGFPCQDVSLAGPRAGLNGARSGLWAEFARLIRKLRPRYVVVENTPGLLSLGMGTVLGDLAESGYDAEWCCLPTGLNHGHRRERIWIVAYPLQSRLSQRRNAEPHRGDEAHIFTRERFASLFEVSVPAQKWADRSLLRRGVSRIPGRVDRVKALGNAIVPAVAEAIFRAIDAAQTGQTND